MQLVWQITIPFLFDWPQRRWLAQYEWDGRFLAGLSSKLRQPGCESICRSFVSFITLWPMQSLWCSKAAKALVVLILSWMNGLMLRAASWLRRPELSQMNGKCTRVIIKITPCFWQCSQASWTRHEQRWFCLWRGVASCRVFTAGSLRCPTRCVQAACVHELTSVGSGSIIRGYCWQFPYWTILWKSFNRRTHTWTCWTYCRSPTRTWTWKTTFYIGRSAELQLLQESCSIVLKIMTIQRFVPEGKAEQHAW